MDEKVVEQVTEPGDHDKFAHFFRNEELMIAMTEGVPIKALCGIVKVPTRDGQKFPKCPECVEAWEKLEED